MKTTVSVYDFHDAFKRANRQNQFSYAALNLLFDYFEQIEQDTGEESELDVVGICCEFAEATWQEIANDYLLHDKTLDDESQDHKSKVLDYLADEGVLIGETDDSIVYRQH
jgi:predicted ArsR family transcriptional regulator